MEQEQAMDTGAMRPMRACRTSAMHRPGDFPGAFRSPQEQPEVDRRVAIYTRQIETQGFITWIPRRENTD
jgi:hypothetical protein